MKRLMTLLLALFAGLLLATGALAAASSLSLQETNLQPGGQAAEINIGSDGLLYVSNYIAGQIWVVDPAAPQATKFQLGLQVSDAHRGPDGNIWFVDGATSFVRLNPTSNQYRTWDVPYKNTARNLGGLAFDDSGMLWMTEWTGAASKVYRFDLTSTQLCTYTLPLSSTSPNGSSASEYILSRQGQLWLANRILHRIYRLVPDNAGNVQATWWNISNTQSLPLGIALDASGNLWWADEGLKAIGRLDPSANEITIYNLPLTNGTPQMLALQGDAILFTAVDKVDEHGYFGTLVPQQSSAQPYSAAPGNAAASKQCAPNWLPTGDDMAAVKTPIIPPWSTSSITQTLDTSPWQMFQLPSPVGYESYAHPFGIAIADDELWMDDRGRWKLMHLPTSGLLKNNIFIPIIIR